MIQIKKKALCSGCYSCANACPKNCIEMKIDEEGFWYPYVNKKKCIDCKLCEKKCPIINKKNQINNLPKAYACYNLDEEIRLNSSSGGIFTLLAEKVLEEGGLVYGAAFDSDLSVKHIQVDNIKDLYKLRGSKYVQSRIGNAYNEIKEELKKGRLIYFSGTPCQIDGLQQFLNKKFDNLICQDIICHGVPSPNVWKKYISTFNLSNNAKINFRNKKTGWKLFSFEITDIDYNYSQPFNKNLYMRAFLQDLCLRPSCYECNSKSLFRNSDITLADFWGIDRITSSINDDKGISLVFVNSVKGKKIFSSISDKMKSMEVDINQAVISNPSSHTSAKKPKDREIYLKKVIDDDFYETTKKYTKVSLLKRVINKIRRTIKNRNYK